MSFKAQLFISDSSYDGTNDRCTPIVIIELYQAF